MVFGVFCFWCCVFFFFFERSERVKSPHPMAIWNPLCFSSPSSVTTVLPILPPEPPSLLPLPTLCVWALHSGSCSIPVFEPSPTLAPSTRPPGSPSRSRSAHVPSAAPFLHENLVFGMFLTLGAGSLALSSSVWSNEEGKEGKIFIRNWFCVANFHLCFFVFVYLFWSVCARPAAAEISFAFN